MTPEAAPHEPLPGDGNRRRDWLPDGFTCCLIAAFFVANTFVVVNHVMWRDETQFWLIVRHVPSFAALIRQLGYEGHPIAWFLCLWILNKLGAGLLGMKLFHVVVVTATIYLFTRYAPFSRAAKVLFAFGYFPFFEFGTIVHYYAIEILFVMLACVAFTRAAPPRRFSSDLRWPCWPRRTPWAWCLG